MNEKKTIALILITDFIFWQDPGCVFACWRIIFVAIFTAYIQTF